MIPGYSIIFGKHLDNASIVLSNWKSNGHVKGFSDEGIGQN